MKKPFVVIKNRFDVIKLCACAFVCVAIIVFIVSGENNVPVFASGNNSGYSFYSLVGEWA